MFRKIITIFAIIIILRSATIYSMEQEQSTLCKIPRHTLLHIANYSGQKGIFNLASTCPYLYKKLGEKRIFTLSGSSKNIIDALQLIKEKEIRYLGIKLLLVSENLEALGSIFNEIDNEIKLKILKLSLVESNLKTLPGKISHLSSLRELCLNNNKLNSNVIKIVSRLTNLTQLSLKYNILQVLPQKISCLSNLSCLDLENNCLGLYNAQVKLDYLPTKLRQLSLSENDLRVLPEGTSLLTNLTLLDLSGNHIESESLKWLRSLAKLAHLSLSNCVLYRLPEEIGNLSGLTSLDLSFNKLQTLPAKIEKLTKLKTLSLGKNKISKGTVNNIQKVLPNTQIIIRSKPH